MQATTHHAPLTTTTAFLLSYYVVVLYPQGSRVQEMHIPTQKLQVVFAIQPTEPETEVGKLPRGIVCLVTCRWEQQDSCLFDEALAPVA